MTTADGRPVIAVACGVLRKPGGEVLLAQRPAGKIAAGSWEFPGGKIEPGEPAEAALARELHEELGIVVRQARPLIRLRHAYSNRIVILDTWLVTAFDGEPQGRENQALAWTPLSGIAAFPTLPTVGITLPALRLPEHYVFTPPAADEDFIAAHLGALPRGALLRLRLPSLDDAAYEALARRLLPRLRRAGLKLALDRSPELSLALAADAHHASQAAWGRLRERPVPATMDFFGSAHTREGLQRLAALGADGAVLGHVLPTASHPGAAGLGWGGFREAAADADFPVYAIGGLGPAQLDSAFRHGAQGVAGIGAYWSRGFSGGGSGASESGSSSAAGIV